MITLAELNGIPALEQRVAPADHPIRGIISDLDGVAYRGDTPIEDSVKAFLGWSERGLPYAFVTNNSTKSAAQFAAKLSRIGIPAEYGRSILSRALGEFAKRHPRVEVTVRYAHSDSQVRALAAGELDLAVVFEWEGSSGGEVLMHDPTVWVTSTLHHMHEERPVPIALYSRNGWCRDFAIKSLQQRGLDYRVAYTSDTNGGLTLAVTSGLAIAPISRSNIPPDCRELTAADGFGDIDSSNVVLHRNPLATGEAIDGMENAIREAFMLTRQAGATVGLAER